MTSIPHINHNPFRGMPIGVACGGTSQERGISLKTGRALANALREFGYNVTEYDLPNDLPILRKSPPAAVVMAMHGGFGENGTLQGWLELEGIPYTGSGVAASALAMDKYRSKSVMASSGLPTPDGWSLNLFDIKGLRDRHHLNTDAIIVELTERFQWGELPLPLVLKQNNAGSSFGVSLNKSREELLHNLGSLIADNKDDDPSNAILFERVVPGPEYSVGVFDSSTPLGAIRITPAEEFYDFKAKYQSNQTHYSVVDDGPLLDQLVSLALKAYQVLGLSGIARIDIIGDDDNLRILEANTLPGMTETSLIPKLAQRLGYDFPSFANLLLSTASQRQQGGEP